MMGIRVDHSYRITQVRVENGDGKGEGNSFFYDLFFMIMNVICRLITSYPYFSVIWS
ncbi:uncharacterized protein BDW47DRAFT_103958 [Aspergillus candidus]|uniref:Uncharacterized protein n=1 Tax=Aspergillus candidus TaxID=41067 RepID=A0A2I2FE79_ASPCN|nr:hypothetical protein BDW47DRAFT_103958 [Aspergillus candidus]PLB38932.1 hypothetical protein BDW47DRAFT_103958 [Aspergillus candidus]